MRVSNKQPILIILWGAVALYFCLFVTISSLRHYNFQTQTWDMGVFVQTFWNSTQGRFMVNSLEEAPNTLGVHMSPWLFLLVPGYALFPSAYYLLVVQTFALAIGAIPLYYLGKAVIKNEKAALIMTLSYLLYPSLHWINLFDFHAISFFVPLMITAFYYIEQARWSPASIFLVLAASTREDAVIAVIFLGITLLLLKSTSSNQKEKTFWTPKRVLGISISIIASIYFILSIKLLMPAFGGGLLRIDRYAQFGSSISEIIQTILKNPQLLFETIFTKQKLIYLFWLFAPVAFLPLLSGRISLLLVPGLLENLLTNFSLQFSGIYQYDSMLIPGIFICSIYGVNTLLKKKITIQKIQYSIAILMCIGFLIRSPINPFFFPTNLFSSTPHWQSFRQIIPMIPNGPSVAAHTNLVPHLAHRQNIYMLGKEPFPVDILIVDGQDSFGFKDFDSFEEYISRYTHDENYTLRVIKDRYAILTRRGINLLR